MLRWFLWAWVMATPASTTNPATPAWIPSPFGLTIDAPSEGAWRVRYELSEDQDVSLSLVDELGCPVVELVDAFERAGEHTVDWRAATEFDSSRVRFGRLCAGSFIETVSVPARP